MVESKEPGVLSSADMENTNYRSTASRIDIISLQAYDLIIVPLHLDLLDSSGSGPSNLGLILGQLLVLPLLVCTPKIREN